jgi:hypothetical protein
MDLEQQHSWLVHRLCGRPGVERRAPPPSQPAQPARAAFLRTPGTLAEAIVVNRTTEGEGRDARGAAEGPRLSGALGEELVLQYDDVSARQV